MRVIYAVVALVVVGLAAAGFCGGIGDAQKESVVPGRRAQAAAEFSAATELYRKEDFVGALAGYLRADELFPSTEALVQAARSIQRGKLLCLPRGEWTALADKCANAPIPENPF